MKQAKKIVGILLALVMVFALAVPAFAATVTVPSDGILKDHTFTAYQIFSGREEDGILSDVQWGSGINSDAFLAALKADTTYGSQFTDCTDAAAVAKVLGDNNTNTALANAVAKLAYANKTGTGTPLTSGENTLDDGYYLVVDTTENVAAGSAYNTALLQVVGDINITVKTDAPTVEKKVLEDDKYDQDGGYGQGYNDVADYNMGDAVYFHLIGSVPDMSRYDTYKYIFHDTLSAGLTLNEDSIKVYVASDKAGTDKAEITGWNNAVNGQSFTVSFTDLKTVSGVSQGKYIIVEYTATLNQNAVVGLDGNPNVVYLEYSNKPDQSGSGDNNTGNTPEDKVIVFTYELDTTKVDGQDNTKKLEGAEFKLHNADNKWAIVDTNNKVTGWADTEEDGSALTSDANGLFKVIGLDDGTYYLKETKAPTGYNLLSSKITVVITATTTNGQTWTDGLASSALTKLEVTADGTAGTGDTSTGIAGITVANNKGSTLPETGGVGTPIFYIAGGVLAVAAAILLVTKKRMSKQG
ncbi:isopeptide-forming domain-containing fimbrial protein [Anaeromassilibacillus senegalensis]|uniref:Isopeptide-forming domain-containing fimbrial protein n=1 Tax=Anaeromassilibacillus senegalensis TaxID=1673717 RepID=A0ABS9CK59_9FIRM|nr:isopeptide-forming domain-containing fimbrial protein [Anaeromassilibacillus senegalensis]MCF2650993.1 isopeptide-forming domain-containing fimbrial protein [Anaeromassilibacillus senegalensis]